MIREDCFWHKYWRDESNDFVVHECHLAGDEVWSCTDDCKWYINQEAGMNEAYAKLYSDMLKE